MTALRRSPPLRQAGLTLVELMVSIALGLFVLLALITMLVNVNRNNLELSGSSRVVENGRFAMELLQADVAHAGFWGGFVPQFDDLTLGTGVPGDVPTAVPDPCVAYTPAAWDLAYTTNLIGMAVQGTDLPSPLPSPVTPVCSTVVTNPKPSTDVLVVRRVEPCLVGQGTDDCADTRALASPHLYFQHSRCRTEVPTGSAVEASYGFGTSTFSLRAGDCEAKVAAGLTPTDAPIRRFSSSIYYVRTYANTPGDGIPTLVRSRFGVSNTAVAGNAPAFQPAEALVEGVEGFRVEYGLDDKSDTGATVNLASLGAAIAWQNPSVLTTPTNRGNGLPDTYVRCTQASPCTADQLVNVVAVKVYVLVRAEQISPGHTDTKTYCLASVCSVAADYMGPFNDGYKRQVYTRTIRLTNVAGRRETP